VTKSLILTTPAALDLPIAFIPPIVRRAGERVRRRWVEFFTAELTNDNTRLAYATAANEFFDWLERLPEFGGQDGDFFKIATEHVATYREWLVKSPALMKMRTGQAIEKRRSVTTVKLKMSAIRSLFRWLKEGGILAEDPAASVRAPKHSVSSGKTPVLTGSEAALILDKITLDLENKPNDLVALRDRALIGVMTFTLARISAAVGMTVSDVFLQGKRHHVRLREKGGKHHVMPLHHEAEEYLLAYIDGAGIRDEPLSPLFRAFDPKNQCMSRRRLSRLRAWEMVQRRAKAAGIRTKVRNHTFRATGITTFLENGGAIEKAREMAAHASIRTTQLYDRRNKAVKMDDVVLINLRASSRSK
jgi:site-specific recombinase XerD